MKRFNKIVIIGVGLIGGSIGLAVKQRKLAKTVLGICRRKVSAKAALKARAVDVATSSYEKGLKGADLIIVATPVGKIVDAVKRITKFSKKKVIVTDVGSTKEKIVKEASRILPRHIKFIGAHPMAGSEKSGIQNADKNLFVNSICILTKTSKTDKRALGIVKKFWQGLGASCRILSPAEHDYYISLISHLPHIVAASLAAAVSTEPKSLNYASTGFKDTTRIAASEPNLWQDIFMTNRIRILSSLAGFKKMLAQIEHSIRVGDGKYLKNVLMKSKKVRDKLN